MALVVDVVGHGLTALEGRGWTRALQRFVVRAPGHLDIRNLHPCAGRSLVPTGGGKADSAEGGAAEVDLIRIHVRCDLRGPTGPGADAQGLGRGCVPPVGDRDARGAKPLDGRLQYTVDPAQFLGQRPQSLVGGVSGSRDPVVLVHGRHAGVIGFRARGSGKGLCNVGAAAREELLYSLLDFLVPQYEVQFEARAAAAFRITTVRYHHRLLGRRQRRDLAPESIR